jgi:alpha-glucosidase (family GH31 glycosyl hydrolase)
VPASLAGEVRFAFPTTDSRSESVTLDRFLVDGHAPATAPQVRQLSPGVNASRDVADERGALTYQPIPFYMSLRGYGLWLDTTSEATFDLNVTDPSRILVKFFGKQLRVVLFEGPRFPSILQRFTALVGRQQLPPYWAFAPWKARDYHRNMQEVYEDVDMDHANPRSRWVAALPCVRAA